MPLKENITDLNFPLHVQWEFHNNWATNIIIRKMRNWSMQIPRAMLVSSFVRVFYNFLQNNDSLTEQSKD